MTVEKAIDKLTEIKCRGGFDDDDLEALALATEVLDKRTLKNPVERNIDDEDGSYCPACGNKICSEFGYMAWYLENSKEPYFCDKCGQRLN